MTEVKRDGNRGGGKRDIFRERESEKERDGITLGHRLTSCPFCH